MPLFNTIFSELSSSSSSEDDSESGNTSWSSLLGANWRTLIDSDSNSTTSGSSDLLVDAKLNSLPNLGSISRITGMDDEICEESSSESDEWHRDMFMDPGADGADEEDSDSEDEDEESHHLSCHVCQAIRHLYIQCYEVPRDEMPQGPGYIYHVLDVLMHQRPDLFHEELHITPQTFQKILSEIIDDPIFSNELHNEQRVVHEQLAITLYHFGHSGNAASQQKVARWVDAGKGSIGLITRRVMTAILRPQFMMKAVHMPTVTEKADAKAWVAAHSCKAWRNGWCMVDGTLIPLYDRPYWYGESYFDWKCNYSLNLQVSDVGV